MEIECIKNGRMSDRGTNVACAHQLWINCLSAYIWICGFVIHRICAFVICGICHRCRQDRFWAVDLAKVNVAKSVEYKLFQHCFQKQYKTLFFWNELCFGVWSALCSSQSPVNTLCQWYVTLTKINNLNKAEFSVAWTNERRNWNICWTKKHSFLLLVKSL